MFSKKLKITKLNINRKPAIFYTRKTLVAGLFTNQIKMKTYLITFLTNYKEAGLIITTDKGIEYAKSRAECLGAWDGYSIEEINTTEEGVYCSVNFGNGYFGKLNDKGECS